MNMKYYRKQRSALPCQDGKEEEKSRVHVLVNRWQFVMAAGDDGAG